MKRKSYGIVAVDLALAGVMLVMALRSGDGLAWFLCGAMVLMGLLTLARVRNESRGKGFA